MATNYAGKKEKNLRNTQTVLESIDNEEKIDEEVLNTNEFGETINRIIVKINNVLRVTENHNISQSQEGNSNSVNIATQLPSEQKIRARLPKLSLKRFPGKPTEWQSFWDS